MLLQRSLLATQDLNPLCHAPKVQIFRFATQLPTSTYPYRLSKFHRRPATAVATITGTQHMHCFHANSLILHIFSIFITHTYSPHHYPHIHVICVSLACIGEQLSPLQSAEKAQIMLMHCTHCILRLPVLPSCTACLCLRTPLCTCGIGRYSHRFRPVFWLIFIQLYIINTLTFKSQ